MFKLYGNYMFKYSICLIWKDLFDFCPKDTPSISGPLGPYNFPN